MEILIQDIDGHDEIVLLEDAGKVYEDDDVIYFASAPYRLSTARHNIVPVAEVRFSCGRYYLTVADIVVVVEGDRCRAMLPEDAYEPIPADELNIAAIDGKPAKDYPIDIVRFFRGDNWTQKMLEYVAQQINAKLEQGE